MKIVYAGERVQCGQYAGQILQCGMCTRVKGYNVDSVRGLKATMHIVVLDRRYVNKYTTNGVFH